MKMKMEICRGTRIIFSEDCGNAPKKKTLLNLYIAFACDDEKFILENISDKFIWRIIGSETIDSKERMISLLKLYRNKKIEEIQIKNIITHGNTAAVNGNIVFYDASIFGFCDIYNFGGFAKNAKIKEISSYVIRIESFN